MFPNGGSVLISGGSFNQFNDFDGNSLSGGSKLDKGLELLLSKVVAGALHNSGERFDPPKCHPNTRKAILDDIVDWLNQPVSEPPSTRRSQKKPSKDLKQGPFYSPSSTWLKGPAGAGKSAIAQMFAQMCHDEGQLSSTFFFSRTGDTGRNDEKRLVASLAYQMSKHIPETQPYISAAVLSDPLIFDMSLESQVDALMVIPLSRASNSLSKPLPPKAIILDGLDECLKPDVQRMIVKVFVKALGRMQHNLPHKLLIASRPESHLVSVFSERNIFQTLKRLTLDDAWEPDEDIRLFLTENFADIKQSHPLSARLASQWPLDEDIDSLVRKSSGQFIYAATVIKCLKSDRHHPAERLKVILGLSKDKKNRPYADLDALYTHIFSNVEDLDLILRVLRIFLMNSVHPPPRFPPESVKAAQHVLELANGVLEQNLNDLSAVLAITNSGFGQAVKFLHASLPEYLLDEARSGKFYVNSENICVDLMKRCLSSFPNNLLLSQQSRINLIFFGLAGFVHFEYHIRHRRSEIYRAIFDFDLDTYLDSDTFYAPGLLTCLTSFLAWSLNEYNESLSSADRFLMLAFVNRLRNWFFTTLKQFPFNGFDNPAGLDLTVFAMTSSLSHIQRKCVLDALTNLFQETLQKYSVTIRYQLPHKIELCWKMMPALSSFFEDAELAEVYTMTRRRYGHAALHCLRGLLYDGKLENVGRLPKPTYKLAMNFAIFFLPKAEAQDELSIICREIIGIGNHPDKTQDFLLVREDEDEDPLYMEASSSLEKLIDRIEERADGTWRLRKRGGNVIEIRRLARLIVEYLRRVRASEQDAAESATAKTIIGHQMGVQPWPRNFTTMRWYSFCEQNILKWINSFIAG